MPRAAYFHKYNHPCAHLGCNASISPQSLHCRAHIVQPPRPKTPPEVLFWRHVDKGDGCWEWTGSKSPLGYGSFNLGKGKRVPAHSFSFASVNGPVPEGLEIDHVCHNPSCVNPSHLRLASHAQNMANMRRPSSNTSGLKGAFWVANRGRWMSQIKAGGRLIYLGYFDTAAAAHEAYCRAAIRYHGEFANFGEGSHVQG